MPVVLRDGAACWLHPRGEPSWRLTVKSDVHPHALARTALAELDSAVLVVHSTSWRYDRGCLVLTYLAVLDDLLTPAPGFRAVWIEPQGLARGDATGPPPTIGVRQVVEHGLHHLSWLAVVDAAVRNALSSNWLSTLAAYRPEPFVALGPPSLPQSRISTRAPREEELTP